MTATQEELDRYAELQTIAFDCARNGDTLTLEKMIVAGMPVDLRDEKGNSFLMIAAYNGNAETVSRLLARGADPDLRNDRGQTPLAGVAFKGYSDVAKVLVDHGADIEADQGGGQTPLMFATMFGRSEVAELLKNHGADRNRRGKFGLKAKHWSIFAPIFQSLVKLVSSRKPATAH